MAIKPIEILITAKDKASEVFGGLRSTALAAGVAIAGYFTARLFGGAVSGAAELEAKLSEVRSVSGATAEEMQALAQAAEDAGATTRYTATEAADALGNLSRAGLSANQSIAALPATLQLAQAGGIDLGRSSEIVTRSLAGFGLAAEEAGRVADVLAKGANASNTSVDGLAQALSYAAPTAVSMGLSLEQTVAIIGKFADAGIDASRAGTALNSILAQFSNPASSFRKELAAAGITTSDFGQALRELEAAGPRGQKAILAVGQEAGPALRALLNQGIGSLDELKAKLDAASGSAAETAATMEDNLQGAARGLGSAWDTVLNVLGTPVLPVLKDGVNQLAGALRGAVSDGTVAKFGNAIASGFRAALEWGRNFLSAIDVDAIADSFGSAAERVGTWFDSVAAKAKAAGASVQLVWGVMQAGASTVLAVVYKVGEAFAGVASNAQSAIAGLVDVLAKVSFGQVSAAFASMAAQVRTSAEATWAVSEAFANKASGAFDSIADGAELARKGWATLTTEAETATRQQQASKAAIDQVAEGLQDMGTKGTEAGAKVSQGANAARASLQQLGGQVKATAEEIAAAFERAGVQTKQELATAAANARADFELIKASGQATSDGLAAAWRRAADAATASGDAQSLAFVRSTASARGFELATDEAGKTTVRAMGAATQAVAGVGAVLNTVGQQAQQTEGYLARLEKRARELSGAARTDSQGFAADGNGQRIVAGSSTTTRTGVANFLQQAGMAKELAEQLAQELSTNRGDIDAERVLRQYGRRSQNGSYYIDSVESALLRAAEQQRFGGTAGAATPAPRTVNVNLSVRGQTDTIAVASDADATRLVEVLRRAGLSA
jgi:TP901 family phage tail tape measure protein